MKSTLLSTLMLVAVGVQPVSLHNVSTEPVERKTIQNRISDVIGTNGSR